MGYGEGRDIELVAELLDRAEEQGFLTTEDILEVLPDMDEDGLDPTDDILIALVAAGVKIYEDKDDVPSVSRRALIGEIEEEDEDESNAFDYRQLADLPEEESSFDLSGIASDDTVGLYLKEMAQVPLLTTGEEIDLARRLEQGLIAAEQLAAANGNQTQS